uniref:Ribosomal RNA-processing protein 42 n=1 Tax=Leptocylindrus danicus TaxID=163516 RepID=A0A7S2PKB9_9STRA|mmetsp:Transcript_4841/g.7042  ORF Transcript_4841/g.7042 Transcript_4841/m.7042 type:complete len:311 (+) Transcript_4841:88-1020(+)
MPNQQQESISQSEIVYTLQGCESNIRSDGRELTDVRPYEVTIGSILLSNGSARVSLPNGGTDILCSIKAEVVSSSSDVGVVEVAVEFLAGANTVAGSRIMRARQEAELSKILHKLLTSAVDLKGLCIVRRKWCWKLCVDILVVSSDGSLIDTCSLAVCAALNSTLLPNITPVDKKDSGGSGAKSKASDDFLVDGDINNAVSPPGSELCPISITVCKVGKQMIVDALPDEEICSTALVSVSVDRNGTICGVQKCGAGSLPGAQLNQIIDISVAVSKAFFAPLQRALQNQKVEGGASNVASSDLLQNYFEFV